MEEMKTQAVFLCADVTFSFKAGSERVVEA